MVSALVHGRVKKTMRVQEVNDIRDAIFDMYVGGVMYCLWLTSFGFKYVFAHISWLCVQLKS